VIRLNGLLTRDRVHAAPEDLDLVPEHIRSHCPGAEK
jgi:hypothetical protein